jgi:hypothetical protein
MPFGSSMNPVLCGFLWRLHCIGVIEAWTKCQNVVRQKGHGLKLIDQEGKHSKACLFTFFLTSFGAFLPLGYGAGFWNEEGLMTSY